VPGRAGDEYTHGMTCTLLMSVADIT